MFFCLTSLQRNFGFIDSIVGWFWSSLIFAFYYFLLSLLNLFFSFFTTLLTPNFELFPNCKHLMLSIPFTYYFRCILYVFWHLVFLFLLSSKYFLTSMISNVYKLFRSALYFQLYGGFLVLSCSKTVFWLSCLSDKMTCIISVL